MLNYSKKHKKGIAFFAPLLLLFLIITLSITYNVLKDKKASFNKEELLGDEIKKIIHEGHDTIEKALFSLDHLASISASKTIFSLLKNGGHTKDPPCGQHPNTPFNLWSQKGRDPESCLPDINKNIIIEFQKDFSPTQIENIYPVKLNNTITEYSIINDQNASFLLGLSDVSLSISQPINMKRAPNFNVKLPVSLKKIKGILNELQELMASCSIADNADACVKQNKPNWPSGSDCGNDNPNDRYVLFCLDLNKKFIYSTNPEPFIINFAAYLPLGVDFEIVNFKFAKDIITEDKSFARTEEQLPLSFSGELHLNIPIGIDKLTGFLYKDDKKGPAITIEGAETQYSFSGEYQSKKGETHNIKLVFSAGEFIKSTPLLTVTVQ